MMENNLLDVKLLLGILENNLSNTIIGKVGHSKHDSVNALLMYCHQANFIIYQSLDQYIVLIANKGQRSVHYVGSNASMVNVVSVNYRMTPF